MTCFPRKFQEFLMIFFQIGTVKYASIFCTPIALSCCSSAYLNNLSMLLSKDLEGIWNYWRTLSNHPPRCRYGRFEFWGFYFFEKCGRCGDRVPKMLYRGPVKNKKNLWHWVVIIFGCVCHATSIDYRSIGRLSRSQSWSPGPWWLDKQEFLSGKKKKVG